MIYNNDDNPNLKIIEFGHGSVKICPTNDHETMVANGVAFIHDNEPKPIGTKNPADEGKDIRDFDNVVLLMFKNLDSLDILIEDLNTVRRGMVEQKSVQEVDDGRA
jgi:hypothetical protein